MLILGNKIVDLLRDHDLNFELNLINSGMAHEERHSCPPRPTFRHRVIFYSLPMRALVMLKHWQSGYSFYFLALRFIFTFTFASRLLGFHTNNRAHLRRFQRIGPRLGRASGQLLMQNPIAPLDLGIALLGQQKLLLQ